MKENLYHYYLSKKEPFRGCLLALQSIIHKQDEDITEDLKWSIPSFSYKNRMFCNLCFDKKRKQPYIVFWEGDRMNHWALEKGHRSKMKAFYVDPTEDIALDTLIEILNEALDLFRNGIIKIKKRNNTIR